MTYYPKAGLIFLDVPKSGTTSVKQWLLERHGPGEGEAHMLPDEYVKKGVCSQSQYDGANKLLVARNIFDRVLSAYGAATNPNAPFEHFVGLMLGAKFRPYCYSIMDYIRGSPIDIVRFDRLEEGFPGIEHLNKSVRPLPKNPYTPKTIKLIQEGYAEEIEFWGWRYEESQGVRLSN